jgi:hypothetical protein
MAAYEHCWLQTPPEAFGLKLDDVRALDAIVAALNTADVGGSGWRYAGVTPEGRFIILVRELPPPGALTAAQAMAKADADALVPAKSSKK